MRGGQAVGVRRKGAVAAVAMAAVAAAVLMGAEDPSANGRPEDSPFHGRNENGERVHIMPSPDVLRSPKDATIFAPRGNASTVFPASYGSGKLTYHGGKIIATPSYYAIYWNSAVANSNATSLGYATIQAQMAAFVGTFLAGLNFTNSSQDDYSIVQQYTESSGASPVPTPAVTYLGSFVDTKATQTSITDTSIRSYLTSFLAARPSLINPRTIFALYFPAGMSVRMGNSGSCSSFCGYHSKVAVNGVQIKYAVYPYLNCSGCKLSSLSVADMLTIINSHEIREAVTDPGDNGVGAWYDAAGYEGDDKCAWHNLYQLNRASANLRFWVQPEYSNGGTVQGVTYPGAGCVVPAP